MGPGAQHESGSPAGPRGALGGGRGRILRRNMRASLIDGTTYSVMLGLGELYLAAFLLEMSSDQVASGLITTIPVLLGCLLQLVSPWAVRRLASNRRWVVAASLTQSLSFIPLAIAAFWPGISTAALFALATLYWVTGKSTGAAWTSWIGTVIPARIRAHYFGYRNRWCQGGTLAGLLIGGVILRAAQLTEAALSEHARGAGLRESGVMGAVLDRLPGSWTDSLTGVDLSLWAFGLLFVLAAICRGISTWYLWLQTERLPLAHVPRPVSIGSAARTFGKSSTGRLFTSMCAFQAAMQVAQPFLNPFLLAQIHLSYDKYMMLIAAAYVGRMAALPTLGRLAKRFGAQRVMLAASIAAVPLPLGWMVTSDAGASLAMLLATQLLFGVMMAAWELSTFLLLFQSIPDRDRTQAIATWYVGDSFSMTVGSMLGGVLVAPLIARMGGVHAYWAVFGVSIALRLAVVPLVLRAARGGVSRPVEPEAEPLLQQARS